MYYLFLIIASIKPNVDIITYVYFKIYFCYHLANGYLSWPNLAAMHIIMVFHFHSFPKRHFSNIYEIDSYENCRKPKSTKNII